MPRSETGLFKRLRCSLSPINSAAPFIKSPVLLPLLFSSIPLSEHGPDLVTLTHQPGLPNQPQVSKATSPLEVFHIESRHSPILLHPLYYARNSFSCHPLPIEPLALPLATGPQQLTRAAALHASDQSDVEGDTSGAFTDGYLKVDMVICWILRQRSFHWHPMGAC